MTGGNSSFLLATAGTEDRIHFDGGEFAVRRWKVVPVNVKGILRIVLVCEAEDGEQGFDVVDQRVTSGVDTLEEYFECFWRIIDVDDRELWGSDRRRLWDREHVSKHRGRDR